MPGGPHPPWEVIASWPPANLVNPEGRGMVTTILACVFTPITLFVLFARFWVRFRMQRNPGIDDWLMVAALPLIAALAILIPWTADKYHSGVHIWDVDLTLFTIQRKLILTIEILFVLAGGLIKVSILLFFRRLGARGTSKLFRTITWIAIGFQVGSTIAFFISPLVGCRPLSGYWEQSDVVKIVQGVKFNCNEEGAAMAVAGIVSTIQDAITAVLPNFIYWKAKIPVRQKAALMAIFAIGYMAAAFGALRTHATWVLFYDTYDVSWQLWEIWNWTTLELHIGVICANAPALRPFVKRYLDVKSIVSKRDGQSSRTPSSQAKSSQTGSKASSNPSGKSSKFSAWKDVFANHGYYSQPTQFTVDDLGNVHYNKEMEGDASDPHTSEDLAQGDRRYVIRDLEMGIPKDNLLQPPKPSAQRYSGGSVGLASCYLYDENEGGKTDGDIRYMRARI